MVQCSSPTGSMPPEGGESPLAHPREHEGGSAEAVGQPATLGAGEPSASKGKVPSGDVV
jgi:hypothetical protein